MVIIGGQPGSGKTDLIDIAMTELRDNVVICNADQLRDFHPYSQSLKAVNEDWYRDITAPFAKEWNDILRQHCEAKQLNIILETTFSSGPLMNQTIRSAKERNYQVQIKLIAVPPQFSYLSTIKRYETALQEEGSARIVGKQAHDERFEKLFPTVQDVCRATLYDRIAIYKRNYLPDVSRKKALGVLPVVVKTPFIHMAFLEEIEPAWTDDLKRLFDHAVLDVEQMMINRNASSQEIQQFRQEMKAEYPSIKQALQKNIQPSSQPLLKKKRIQTKKGRGKGL
ncbi:MAG: zeta toxin family protein [Sediminibacterium sp.]